MKEVFVSLAILTTLMAPLVWAEVNARNPSKKPTGNIISMEHFPGLAMRSAPFPKASPSDNQPIAPLGKKLKADLDKENQGALFTD